MRTERAGVVNRAVNKVRRWSVRARDRVQGLPIRARHRGLPIPPPDLLHKVGNSEDVAWFLHAGAEGAAVLREVLERNGVLLVDLDAILDFGCGVGRILRHFAELDGPALHGTDYNPDLIAWCARNLPFARFHVNGLQGPLDFQGGAFDFVYALSVFTHLSESRQFSWIDELTRVLKPGGHLLFTAHGERHLSQLSEAERGRFRAGELVVIGSAREGSNDCAAFHPDAYVRRTLARGLAVVDFLPEGARGNPWQDVYLLRKT